MLRTIATRPGRAVLSAVLGVVAGAVLGAAGVYFYGPRKTVDDGPGTDSSSGGTAFVQGLGRLEPADGLVPVFGSPGDRIVRFLGDADKVDAEVGLGQRLVEMAGDDLRAQERMIAWQQLDDAKEQRRKVEQVAEAKRKEADQEIANLRRSQMAELDGQKSRLAVAERQVAFARTQVERFRSLTAGSVSGSDLRQKELELSKAEADLEAGRAAFRAAEKAFEDGKELAKVKGEAARAEKERAIAAVPVEVAEKTAKAAELKEQLGWIVAPITGRVVRVQAVAGETTTQVKPILQLAGLAEQLVVRVEIPEGEVAKVRAALGKDKPPLPVKITSRTVKGLTLTGELRSADKVARAITRNSVVDLAPSAGSDRRVVEAVVDVTETDPDKLARARALLGLQVDAEITVPEPSKKP